MSDGRLFYDATNPATGLHTRIERDPQTGCALIVAKQPCAELVAFNKRLAAAIDPHAARARRMRKNSGMVHVAAIPVVIWNMLVRHGIARDPVALNKWLSRRDTRSLRVDDGRKL
jgi:hypothetical protein